MLSKEPSCLTSQTTHPDNRVYLTHGINWAFVTGTIVTGIYGHNLLILIQSVLLLQLQLGFWLTTRTPETETTIAVLRKQLTSETVVGLAGCILLVLLIKLPLTGEHRPHDTFTVVMLMANWAFSYWRFTPTSSGLASQLLRSEYRNQYPCHGGLMILGICHWYFPVATWNTSLAIAGWGCFTGVAWILWLEIYESLQREMAA